MSIKEVQLTIRRRHILVTGDLARVIEFDEQGLQSLRTLSAGVRIRGVLTSPLIATCLYFSCSRPVDAQGWRGDCGTGA